jgi:hypothetical protein
MVTRRNFLKLAAGIAAVSSTVLPNKSAASTLSPFDDLPIKTHLPVIARSNPATPLSLSYDGQTEYGVWHADIQVVESAWQPGTVLHVATALRLSAGFLGNLTAAGIPASEVIQMITAERTIDPYGKLRLPSDENVSTLLTPSGLAIEGGMQGIVTDRFGGYPFKTPVDVVLRVLASSGQSVSGGTRYDFTAAINLPNDLPPGRYRLRFDFGVFGNWNWHNLAGSWFPGRLSSSDTTSSTYAYSPPIPASGPDVTGRYVDAASLPARIPWVLMGAYNSNGYQGCVAEEDKSYFNISPRNILPDAVVLPLFKDNMTRYTYSLEPQFPADTIDTRSAIPWSYPSGQLSIAVTGPDGVTADLGAAPFVSAVTGGPTTEQPRFTAWHPKGYGLYTVRATGWINDRWGNRYDGGGTYQFWIAKRMTMATATFQGVSFPVGAKYGRDIGFSPAAPADVTINASLFVNSDAGNLHSMTCSGKATRGGTFGMTQGAQQLLLDAPGEYFAEIFARYTDPDGHLWICSVHHAGVVYAPGTSLIAHGKKLALTSGSTTSYVDRGETHREGYIDQGTGTSHLEHIDFPYQSGDVLLMASENQGTNKIEPVLTYQMAGDQTPWDPAWSTLGRTNLAFGTSNGYSPHLFPEYITDRAYYYGAGVRPGFMSRFLVGENQVHIPYWPTSPNFFGGQIGASGNGDQPGDVYRLVGGAVLRRQGESPLYAGYLSSAFILPKNSQNNRITAAGAEDVHGPDGSMARFFLVGPRPGLAFEMGTMYAPAVQIDPLLPVNIRFTLTYPDGSQKLATGVADANGSFVGSERWALDMAGVYRYWLEADWQGHWGYVPGLPADGGKLYVFENPRPTTAPGLWINAPSQTWFDVAKGITYNGSTTANEVHYTAVIPGAVVDQGVVTPASDGTFTFHWDPATAHGKIPAYDTVYIPSGTPALGKIVHISFFTEERAPDGSIYHDFQRVILRGQTALGPATMAGSGVAGMRR